MPTLHVPLRGGGLVAVEVKPGRSLSSALKQLGLLNLAARQGMELRTAKGWKRVDLSRVLRVGDEVRMHVSLPQGNTAAAKALATVLSKIVSSMKRKKVPHEAGRTGLRRRSRPGPLPRVPARDPTR